MKNVFLVVSTLVVLISGCTVDSSQEVVEQNEVSEIVTKAVVTAQRDPAVEAAILRTSPDYTSAMIEVGGGQKARYLYTRADLNDDGQDEVIVYMLGSIFCGTGGCNLLILTGNEDGYRVVNDFPTSRVPLVATRETSHGWQGLVREVSGGGVPTEYVRYTFDGDRYVEVERLSAAEVPAGEAYLSDDFTFESGLILEPPD